MQLVCRHDSYHVSSTLCYAVLDIIHQKSQEMEQKCLLLKNELEESKSKIARLSNQEAALVQHNAKTSVQLTSEEKKRLILHG